MKSRSLAARLLLAAALWTGVILVIAGVTLSSYNRDLVERGFDQRLYVYLKALVGDLAREADLETLDFTVGEPRFELPLSGWYWQIGRRDVPGSEAVRRSSSSLFDRNLPFLIDQDPEKDEAATREAYVQGPDNEDLRQVERVIQVGSARYVVAVAGETSEMAAEREAFDSALISTFFLLGLGLVSTAAFQVGFGLRPLKRISDQIAAIRGGQRQRLEGNVPSEIAPLARELNALIDGNREIVERARTQAGNLAHAVKTPLSVIVNEASVSRDPAAGKIREQAEIMRRQIEHHLDRARVSAGIATLGAATEAGPAIEALARTMGKVHRDRDIAINVRAAPGRLRVERQDFEEMVGNLLDNACKWAGSRIDVEVLAEPDVATSDWLRVIVDDDGPGLTVEQRQDALTRGRRLDETKPGSGLGLSIVTDLARLYGGSLSLGAAPLGGLRAELRLPAV
ncbi:ATP-binding protein [Terrihabitans sp. B22-R8]|uniref:ATP-binding protein n=1 Tax=Terrihabitans sp. B22-R8 TaxID=3425128 RepID=UPI00403C0EF3